MNDWFADGATRRILRHAAWQHRAKTRETHARGSRHGADRRIDCMAGLDRSLASQGRPARAHPWRFRRSRRLRRSIGSQSWRACLRDRFGPQSRFRQTTRRQRIHRLHIATLRRHRARHRRRLRRVGGETFDRSFRVLKPGGSIVTIVSTENPETAFDERKQKAFFIVEPNQKQLIEVAKLIDGGKLKTFVDAVVPLADAASAYNGSLKNRQGHGKIAVEITAA